MLPRGCLHCWTLSGEKSRQFGQKWGKEDDHLYTEYRRVIYFYFYKASVCAKSTPRCAQIPVMCLLESSVCEGWRWGKSSEVERDVCDSPVILGNLGSVTGLMLSCSGYTEKRMECQTFGVVALMWLWLSQVSSSLRFLTVQFVQHYILKTLRKPL